jgi:drug/metabolite transporter (DMT)-like permease
MIYLVLAIIFNGLIGVIFKLFGLRGVNIYAAISFNYVVCILMATIVLGSFPISMEFFSQPWIVLAILLGLFFPVIFNLYGRAVQHLGVVISTIFHKMSLIAPALVGILIYGEEFTIFKGLGVITAMLAIYFIPKEKTDSNASESVRKYIYLGFLILAGSSLIDTGLYLKDKLFTINIDDLRFTATLFLFALIGSIPLLIQNKMKTGSSIGVKELVAGGVLGVPNFFSIYFILLGLNSLDGSIFFPINNVGILIVSGLAGILFFKEKMNIYKYIGFALAIITIILLQL